MDRRDTLGLLKRCQLFENLSESDLRALEPGCLWMRVSAGNHLFHAGSPGGSLFIIESGELAVEGIRFYEDGGEEVVTYAVRGPLEVIGEMSLFDDAVRSGSVRATKNSSLLQLDGRYFRQHLERQPKVALSMLRTLVAKLRQAQESQMNRETVPLVIRLSKRLLDLIPAEQAEAKSITIAPAPTQKELARHLGCSREAVSRTAASIGDGVIVFGRGRIELRRVDVLRKLVKRST